MSFTALIPEIQLGKVQVIAAGMSPTQERARQVLFTEPHFSGSPLVLISKKEKAINSLNDLSGKTVVVNEGFTSDSYVSNIEGPTVPTTTYSASEAGGTLPVQPLSYRVQQLVYAILLIHIETIITYRTMTAR